LLAGPVPAALGLAVSLNAAGLIGTLAGLAVAMCLVFCARRVGAAGLAPAKGSLA